MDDHIKKSVRRVIEKMHDSVGEQLTVEEMARTAMFSKFHFCRIFQRITGVSPGRFLSAIRFQRAKQLLVSTSLSVTDISHHVGYTSVGTFSSRFSSSVGISPTTYRRLGGVIPRIRTDDDRSESPATPGATIQGKVTALPGVVLDWVFVGLFPDRIQQGRPVRYVILPGPGGYVLDQVPLGTWFLLAHAVSIGAPARPQPPNRDLLVGCHGPVGIRRGGGVRRADVVLRPMQAFDPPVVHAVAVASPVREAG